MKKEYPALIACLIFYLLYINLFLSKSDTESKLIQFINLLSLSF